MSTRLIIIIGFITTSISIIIRLFIYDADLFLISGTNKDEIDDTSICHQLGKYKLNIIDTCYVKIFDKFAVRGWIGNSSVFIKSSSSIEYNIAEDNLKNLPNNELLNQVTKTISDTTTEKLLLCPLPINLPKFFKSLQYDFASIYTAIKTNPESVVLQIIKPPKWPVPKFLGSCGRLDIVEDGGNMLTSYYSAPWATRAKLSIQLLNAAYDFTFKNPNYAFYLTDPSPDNIAVNSEKIITFIDLSSLIIVDKNPVNKGPNFDTQSIYKYEACENCYQIDPIEICSTRITDFNVLQICQVILGEKSLIFPYGFLHDAPNKNITDLIRECVIGRLSRFIILDVLIKFLNNQIP